jgi:tRNA dimethylallyltransferase
MIIIAGATGVGKTSVACAVARRIGGEIISADARQVYKGMAIGTAAPSNEDVPHHLVGVLDPNEQPTAKWWADECARILESLWEKESVPIIAGGTGLYIRALVEGLFESLSGDAGIRTSLKKRIETGEDLHAELERIDPESAVRIHPNNKPRIIRALEVYYSTGKTLTELFGQTESKAKGWEFLKFHLVLPRELLYEKIERRTEDMFEAGWIDEVRELLSSGIASDAPGMEAIGYREICGFLSGEIDIADVKSKIKQATRNYAKRQLTWFRHRPDYCEIDLSKMELIEAVEIILRRYRRKYEGLNNPA